MQHCSTKFLNRYKISSQTQSIGGFRTLLRGFQLFFAILIMGTAVLPSNLVTLKAQSNSTSKIETMTEVRRLTLQECIRLGIDTSFSVIRAKNQLDLTGSQLLSAYGNFLPNLSVNANYTPYNLNNSIQNSFPFVLVNNQTESANFAINSSLNLFNGFADYAGLQQAIANETAQTYTLERAKQDIAFDVAQAYLQILLNQELLKIAQENLKSSQERLRQLKEQTRVGSRAIADLYQQEAQVGADELSVIRNENLVRNSKLALLRRIRLDPIKDYEFVAPEVDTIRLESTFLDPNTLVDSAYVNRSDIQSAMAASDAAEFGIMQAQSSYFPRLNLNLGINSNGLAIKNRGQDSVQFPTIFNQLTNQISYRVTISLSWNIFDGFQRELQVEQAQINAKNTKLNLEDLKLQVVTQVKQSIGDYQAAVQQVESSEKGLKSAKQAYETVQKRYEVGSSTFVELASAQAALVRAQSDRAQALFNFTFQKKILEYFLGTISIGDELKN
ncbi:MAG: TolC family protein [Chloroherpetonaceae bacterium]|nr:TolC family protein [Chloroherpetonaceae bacterium]